MPIPSFDEARYLLADARHAKRCGVRAYATGKVRGNLTGSRDNVRWKYVLGFWVVQKEGSVQKAEDLEGT